MDYTIRFLKKNILGNGLHNPFPSKKKYTQTLTHNTPSPHHALFCIYLRRCCTHPIFTEYPFVGMLPQVLCNLWRAHDYSTQVLKQHGGTGEFTGPWFTSMNYMLTCDSTCITCWAEMVIWCKKRWPLFTKKPVCDEVRKKVRVLGAGERVQCG